MELSERLTGVDLAPAPVVEDAGPDIRNAALARFERKIGIADERAAHADEVGEFPGDHPLGEFGCADASERHHGDGAG